MFLYHTMEILSIPKKRREKLGDPIQVRFTEELHRLKREAEQRYEMDFSEWVRQVLEREFKSILHKDKR